MTPNEIILKLAGAPPLLEVNPDNGFLKLWGCFARTGVQAYSLSELGSDEPGTAGVYRGETFLRALAEGLRDSPFVEDHKSVFRSTGNKPLGHVSDAHVGYIGDEAWIVGHVVISDTDVIEELLTHYETHGQLFIPVSPSYTPSWVEKNGLWVDTLGLLGEEGDSISYRFAQEAPLTVNHLAGVTFGRGGETAGLFAMKAPLTEDSLYPYPQTRASNTKKRKKRMTTKAKAEQPIADGSNAMSMIADQQAKMADAMMKMADALDKATTDMGKTCDGIDSLSKSNDAILGSLESLSSAINKAFEASEGPGSRANAEANNEKTSSEGKARGFLHTGSVDALKADLQSIVEIHKAINDALSAVVPATTVDDTLPSVSQSAVSKPVTAAAGSVQSTEQGSVIL